MGDSHRTQEDGKMGKAIGIRLFIYLIAGHLVGGFFWLMFYLGDRR